MGKTNVSCSRPCSDGKPCLPDEDKCPLKNEIDLDNLVFEIRKSTAKYYRRAKVWVKKGKARIIITDEERWFGWLGMCVVLNHEFLHWILCYITGQKWGLKKYDEFLDSLGLYNHDTMMEMWL